MPREFLDCEFRPSELVPKSVVLLLGRKHQFLSGYNAEELQTRQGMFYARELDFNHVSASKEMSCIRKSRLGGFKVNSSILGSNLEAQRRETKTFARSSFKERRGTEYCLLLHTCKETPAGSPVLICRRQLWGYKTAMGKQDLGRHFKTGF